MPTKRLLSLLSSFKATLLIVLMMVGVSSVSQAKTIGSISLESYVNKQSLACDMNDIHFYQDIMVLFNSIADTKLSQYDTKTQTLKTQDGAVIKNIKHFSASKRVIDYGDIESTKNIDVDILKYGVHVLRASSFDIEPKGEYGESQGYYFVLKGLPVDNLKKLAKYGIQPSDEIVEKTKGNNTRIRCVLAG